MRIKLLAICGSLRTGSTNLELLKAAQNLAQHPIEIEIYQGFDEFPSFKPDLDFSDQLPKSVIEFRQKISNADGLIIACPEYMHSLPGAFKNALDWVVSGPEIPFKPVAIFNASPHSKFATLHLEEILRTMSANLINNAYIDIPMRAENLDAQKINDNIAYSKYIQEHLKIFKHAILTLRSL